MNGTPPPAAATTTVLAVCVLLYRLAAAAGTYIVLRQVICHVPLLVGYLASLAVGPAGPDE